MNAKQLADYIRSENLNWPDVLTEVPKPWPVTPVGFQRPVRLLRSKSFLCQIFQEPNGVLRLTVNRTELAKNSTDWRPMITWEELQDLKGQAGYGDSYAIEIYPRDRDEVNVANMRHLWILPAPLEIGWFAK